ncbi:MAG: flagellar biosynthetic protein FliR [Alphaproteobacteria bacterium]
MFDLPTSHDVFGIFLIFVRVGTALMLMPGFSEPYIFSRSRLLFALLLSVVLAAPITPHLPDPPQHLAGLALLVGGEAFLGVFIGAATRIMFAALHVAGSTIAVQSGLATASVFDPNQSTQGTLPGNFLTTVAMVLLFVTDGHHMLIRGIVESYARLGAGMTLPVGDMAEFITGIVQKGFDLGIQMAAPLLLVGLLTNLAMGVLNRLMPSFQVFFIALPLQLLLSFATLMLSFAVGLLVFFKFLEAEYSTLTLGG